VSFEPTERLAEGTGKGPAGSGCGDRLRRTDDGAVGVKGYNLDLLRDASDLEIALHRWLVWLLDAVVAGKPGV
jgi:hypothetical protein